MMTRRAAAVLCFDGRKGAGGGEKDVVSPFLGADGSLSAAAAPDEKERTHRL